MRILTAILFFLSLYGCKTKDNTSDLTILKENQLRGIVLYLPKKMKDGLSPTIKELYFRVDSKNYFIKLNEGYVLENDLLKYVDQSIVVKGEIKNGLWENQEPESIKFSSNKTEKARSGPYISIEKIYKNKR